jgi:hypothetical protein
VICFEKQITNEINPLPLLKKEKKKKFLFFLKEEKSIALERRIKR